MKIGDKAEQSEQPDVRLASDSIGMYKLKTDELTPADEIGTDEFPKYGDFVECEASHGGANPSWDETVYVEVPGALAQIVVEMELTPGDCFRIQSARKNASGEWQYSVEAIDDPVDS